MRIDGYTELRTLGAGATGSVLMARHDSSGQLVAIKTLAARLVGDPVFLERFRREAALLARLRHPHIAALLWYAEDGTSAAIAMELVDGVELRHLIAGGIATPEVALLVLRGSLDALDHAHQAGVVHRDYKPGNVLVDAEGASRLVDFGIAAGAGEAGIAEGTPKYAAPEQWRGAAASPATDVYACAAVLHECLTGRVPFDAPDMPRLAILHATAPIPLEGVPEALHPLMLRGLAKTPGGRYPTAGAFRDELERLASSTYGPDWAEHGRRALAGLALGAAALFPLHGTGAAAAGAPGGTAVTSTTLASTEVGTAGPATAGAAAAGGAGAGAWLVPGLAALLVAGGLGAAAVKTNAFGLRSSGSSTSSTAKPAEVVAPPASPSASTAPASAAATTSATLGAASDIGPNLLVNGNADAAPGSPDGAQVVPLPGWTTTSNFSANSWDIGNTAFMQRSDPGPRDRGANYFAGGPDTPLSSATQSIDLGLSDAQIAAGATYQLSAWLGGFAEQADNVTIVVDFFGSSGTSLGSGTIGPVTNAERNNHTALIYKAASAAIPAGAVKAVVSMTAARAAGAYDDGYADEVSFEVKAG